MNIEDYNKYYIQGSDHYLIPKDVFKELFNEMINWKEESQRQKEAINKVNKYIKKHSFFVIDTWYNKKIGYPKDTFSTQEILDILKEVSE